MEKTKKSKRATAGAGKDKILKAYRNFLLKEGKQPSSVFTFCETLGIKEGDFYKFFGSFDAIEIEIWKGYLKSTDASLLDDPNFKSFTSREKILAFYFTLAEILKDDRSFALKGLKTFTNPALPPAFIKGFKEAFDAWIVPVLNEGKQNGEIAKRPLLDSRYDSLFWLHLLFIIQFWSTDNSADFEKTDEAIEKSVNLAFDLIGKGILDNALDFGKFLYQQHRN